MGLLSPSPVQKLKKTKGLFPKKTGNSPFFTKTRQTTYPKNQAPAGSINRETFDTERPDASFIKR